MTENERLEGARLALLANAAACTGVRAAPPLIPDSLSVWPTAIVYVWKGKSVKHSGDTGVALWTLVAEFHVAKRDIGRNHATCQQLMVEFMTAVWDFGDPPTLAGQMGGYAVFQSPEAVRGNLAEMEFAGMPTFGVRVELDIKVAGFHS